MLKINSGNTVMEKFHQTDLSFNVLVLIYRPNSGFGAIQKIRFIIKNQG